MADEIILTLERAAELHQRAIDRSDLAVWVISQDEPAIPACWWRG